MLKQERTSRYWILYMVLCISLIFMIMFVYTAAGEFSSQALLWIIFMPLGIVLLIIFLVQKLKFKFER